ncbi:M48 family metalloprotease [Ideonella sp.]|uniref:M48 family metalloprotease n=1 Tax=Ideonella sp. TaxID=1929293 RepID=UPI0035B20E40
MDHPTPLTGQEIGRDEAPALWQVLDALAGRLRMPRLERVVLIAEPGAAAIEHQHPGRPWRRHRTLALGLPLLAGLSAAQMQAVMAHEMVHFSRHFGWFGYWMAWLLQAGRRVWRGRAADGGWRASTAGGARWFGPLLDGPAANAAARAEFEADAWAAEVTSAQALGEALLRLAVASSKPTPTFGDGPLPQAPWRRAAPGLGAAVDAAELARALQADAERHARQTDARRSHPSAAARLQALGWPAPAALPAVPAQDTAGPRWWSPPAWARRLHSEQQRWQAANARAWRAEASWREACAAELRQPGAAVADHRLECAHALGQALPPPPDDGGTPDAVPPLQAYWRGVAWQGHDAAEATLWLQASARHSAGLEAPACLRLLEPMPGRAPLSTQVRQSLADARQRRNEARQQADTHAWAGAEPVQADAWRVRALQHALAADHAVRQALWLQQDVDAAGGRRYRIVTLLLQIDPACGLDEAEWAQAYSPLLARVITPAGVGQLYCQSADAPWPEALQRLAAEHPSLRLKALAAGSA